MNYKNLENFKKELETKGVFLKDEDLKNSFQNKRKAFNKDYEVYEMVLKINNDIVLYDLKLTNSNLNGEYKLISTFSLKRFLK